jgi:hypothetical protein
MNMRGRPDDVCWPCVTASETEADIPATAFGAMKRHRPQSEACQIALFHGIAHNMLAIDDLETAAHMGN